MNNEPKIPARETEYAGHLFRSSLEATWAAFFDQLKWPWVYEPYELKGYIPDFVIKWKHPLLVEVKPEYGLSGLRSHTEKIEKSGWDGEALIVGADWCSTELSPGYDAPAIGLLAERGGDRDQCDFDFAWDAGAWTECGHSFGLTHSVMTYGCRSCGAKYKEFGWVDPDSPQAEDLKRRWGAAKRATRWVRST
jgi:hypothetical protein